MAGNGALFAMQGVNTFGTAAAQAGAQSMQGEVEQARHEQNARFAERNSKDAISRGKKGANNLKQSAKELIGSQRAGFAAQGVLVDSGSAQDVREDTAMRAELDALEIKSNAYREAYGYKTEAINSRGQGNSAKAAADYKSKTTLLTGVNRAAEYGLKSATAFRKGH